MYSIIDLEMRYYSTLIFYCSCECQRMHENSLEKYCSLQKNPGLRSNEIYYFAEHMCLGPIVPLFNHFRTILSHLSSEDTGIKTYTRTDENAVQ